MRQLPRPSLVNRKTTHESLKKRGRMATGAGRRGGASCRPVTRNNQEGDHEGGCVVLAAFGQGQPGKGRAASLALCGQPLCLTRAGDPRIGCGQGVGCFPCTSDQPNTPPRLAAWRGGGGGTARQQGCTKKSPPLRTLKRVDGGARPHDEATPSNRSRRAPAHRQAETAGVRQAAPPRWWSVPSRPS